MTKFLSQDLLNLNDKETLDKLLFDSVKSGSVEMPMLLIGLGADVNYRENGVSVLGVATISGSHVLIPFLTYLSNPETKKITLEVNRTFAERLEEVIPSLKKMIEEMGQSNRNADSEDILEAKKIAELRKEEEKKKEEEEKKKEEEEKKKEEEEKKKEEQIDDLVNLVNHHAVLTPVDLLNLVNSVKENIVPLLRSPEIDSRDKEVKENKSKDWVSKVSSKKQPTDESFVEIVSKNSANTPKLR